MSESILVTGGAGFIGSHLVDELIKEGHAVKVLDNLTPQVHGNDRRVPKYLNSKADFLLGDVSDREDLRHALRGVDVVFHLAAIVGVGQSMYEIHRYVDTNAVGTAMLLDILVNEQHRVRKVIVASSMSVYGEGKYLCPSCGVVYPRLREKEQLARHEWEMHCPQCKRMVSPAPTDEDSPCYPTSIYAYSKRDQEEMSLCIGRAYGIPVAALRYFNVYGPRQALSNPYTGVVAIFSSRLLNNQPPVLYEDGLQSRDYVHVLDVVQANLLAMKSDAADGQVFNVGCGKALTIADIADMLCQKLANGTKPRVTNQFRVGDIRHCSADIRKIQTKLGYAPTFTLERGVDDLVLRLSGGPAVDRFERATHELSNRGLIIS
jgi:dTDP-L-rhamnose 4-epimerase